LHGVRVSSSFGFLTRVFSNFESCLNLQDTKRQFYGKRKDVPAVCQVNARIDHGQVAVGKSYIICDVLNGYILSSLLDTLRIRFPFIVDHKYEAVLIKFNPASLLDNKNIGFHYFASFASFSPIRCHLATSTDSFLGEGP
jgi:hypothetical protein